MNNQEERRCRNHYCQEVLPAENRGVRCANCAKYWHWRGVERSRQSVERERKKDGVHGVAAR